MIHETIDLILPYIERGVSNGNQEVTLTTYILDDLGLNKVRPFVLICPGGGYNHLSKREGEPVAIALNAAGFSVGVLHYTLLPNAFPCAMLDVAIATQYIREHSDKWHIDPQAIIVGGFSAGAHVAASLGCYWNDNLILDSLPYSNEAIKPNALLLCYPVITSDSRYCYKGLVDEVSHFANVSKEVYSLEKHVNEFVPQTFIWHTLQDETVFVQNSLLFVQALQQHNIQFEYHLFQRGRHGLSLGTQLSSSNDGKYIQVECAIWLDLFCTWARGIFNNKL